MATATDPRAKELQERAQKLLSLDYFAALGVARTSSPEDAKKAFTEAAKAWHPDRVPQGLDSIAPLFGKVFARLELARATLADPMRRSKYVLELEKPAAAASADDLSTAEATLEFLKAEVMLKKNDVVEAEKHLRRALHLTPSNAAYRVMLISVQAKPDCPPERLREFVAELDRLIEREPKLERAFFCRGQLRKRLHLTEPAHADFVQAAKLDPNNVEAAREVRIHNMRQDRAAPAPASKGASEGGVGGFFRKLLKRS